MKKKAEKRVKNRIIVVKNSGRVYILISVLLGVIAVNSTNNLLYLTTAVMLGYMLASGIAGRRNIKHLSVSVDFPSDVYAGVLFPVVLNVTNANRFTPVFLIDVSLWQKNEEKRAFFSCIQPNTTESRTIFMTLPDRGMYEFDDIEISSSYPFNFFERFWPAEFKAMVLAYPNPLPFDMASCFTQEEGDGKPDPSTPLTETDIVGVKPYVEGDPMKHIHWKSSARTGKIKTRVYEGAFTGGHIIDLDLLVSKDTERGLSMAAFIVSDSIKAGQAIGLKYQNETFPVSSDIPHKRSILKRLALHKVTP